MSSKDSVIKDLSEMINKKRDYIPFFGTVLRLAVYFLFSLIFYLNFNAQRDYLQSKRIFIKNPGHYCEYESVTIPTISDLSLKNCLTSEGKVNPNLKIYTIPFSGEKYIVSDVSGVYYRTVCNGFCVLKPDGTCQDQPVQHKKCLSLLNPGQNCTNTSKPIGTNNNKQWYAVSVVQTPGCVNFNIS